MKKHPSTKQAIVLAAGIGSRLRPLTEYKPKTLVRVNGKPILGHIIDSLIGNGVDDIVIVTGYLSETIKTFCQEAYPEHSFTFVDNATYDSTNNLYSLYLARKHLTDDTFILNGDLVFDPSVIRRMKDTAVTSVAVDVGRYMEESMKVVVEDGAIKSISKKITEQDAYGCSIDVYKFTRRDLPTLVRELEKTIEGGTLTEWTEAALDRLFAAGAIKARAFPIGAARWSEIDNLVDLHDAETLFNPHLRKLAVKKIFFIDNDGTLTLDGKLLPGANEFLSSLKREKKIVYVLSNNSSYAPGEIAARLKQQGLSLSDKNVLISTQAAMAFFKEKGLKRIFWVANDSTSAWLRKSGFTFDRKKPQALLLCYDTEITYQKLQELTFLIRSGIPYYATHIDKVCPTGKGPVPDIGLFIDMLESVTGKRPLKTFGKPDKNFIRPILKAHGLSPKDAVVIGDRLYTDIALAVESGTIGVLTLSGETNREQYERSDTEADILVGGVQELVPFLTHDGNE